MDNRVYKVLAPCRFSIFTTKIVHFALNSGENQVFWAKHVKKEKVFTLKCGLLYAQDLHSIFQKGRMVNPIFRGFNLFALGMVA